MEQAIAWTTSGGPARKRLGAFQSAFAVRQVEIGLASMLSIVLGATATLFGVALLDGLAYPRWMGALGIAGSASTPVSGILTAYNGFSDVEMAINMPASAVLVAWLIALGVLMWRRDGSGDPAA